MTFKPVTRERVQRRVRKYRHLYRLPKMVVRTGNMPEADGYIVGAEDGSVTILVDDRGPLADEALDKIVLHELAHAENYLLRETLRHDASWRAICRRVSKATGIKVT